MSVQSIFRWRDGALEPLDYCDMTDTSVVVADSWRVVDGKSRAIGLHRDRFLATAGADATLPIAGSLALLMIGAWLVARRSRRVIDVS